MYQNLTKDQERQLKREIEKRAAFIAEKDKKDQSYEQRQSGSQTRASKVDAGDCSRCEVVARKSL